jgi:hypothetical protein
MPFLLSHDGVEWVRGTGGGLAVEPIVQESESGGAKLLGSGGFTMKETQDTASRAVFGLEVPTPNPANPGTRLYFTLPQLAHVNLSIYSLRGELVCTLVDEQCGNGRHDAFWNGLTDRGALAPSGIYFARLVTPTTKAVVRVTIVR